MGDFAGDNIQFHAVQTAVPHGFWEKPKEISNAHRRFQDIAARKTEFSENVVHGFDDCRAGIKGSERGRSGGGVFLRGQDVFQFPIFFRPACFCRVESVEQTAPAYVFSKNLLISYRSLFAGGFQFFQQLNRADIALKFLFSGSLS